MIEAISAHPFATYLAKWHAQAPEMEWLEVFCPQPQQARFRAWGALLNEIEAALLEPSAVDVALRKLAWWMEELAHGHTRHPVSALFSQAVPGYEPAAARVVAKALVWLEEDRIPATLEQAWEQTLPLASAVAEAEQAFFSVSLSSGPPAVPVTHTRAIQVSLFCRAIPVALANPSIARDLLPLNLLARYGGFEHLVQEVRAALAFRADLAAGLLAMTPASIQAPLFRHGRSAFDRWRLKRWSQRKDASHAPPFHSLWLAWRTARQR